MLRRPVRRYHRERKVGAEVDRPEGEVEEGEEVAVGLPMGDEGGVRKWTHL